MGAPEFPYSDDMANDICEAIATSSDGLETICVNNPNFPKPKTIYKWIFTNESFAQKYAHARDLQQEALIAEVIRISKDNSRDLLPDENGRLRSNMAAVTRDRLIADNAKWVAGRLSRKYRDKQDVDSTITINHEDTLKGLS